MSGSTARAGAAALAVASLLAGLLSAAPASAVTGPAPLRAQFDADDFSISSSKGSADGSVNWSRGGGRTVHGRVTGTLRAEDGCARLEVVWLNSANGALSRSRAVSCDSTGFGLAYSSPNLQCVLIRLGSSTRQLCAGGS